MIHNSQQYNDDVVSEIQGMRKMVAFQMKNEGPNRIAMIKVFRHVTEFKFAYTSLGM